MNTIKNSNLILLIALSLLYTKGASQGIDTILMQQSLRFISQHQLSAYTKFLADDQLEGRGIGSRGADIAIKYISTQFEAMGLTPAFGEKSFLQSFPVVGIRPETPIQMTVQTSSVKKDLIYYRDFIAVAGQQVNQISVQNAEIVFVGYGIEAPEYQWNDYKTDVRGKVLLILNNDPDTGDPNFFGGKTRLYYGRWDYKYELAAKKGAVGAIIIHTTPSAGYPWQVVQSSWGREQYEIPQGNEPRMKFQSWVTEQIAKSIASMGGRNLEDLVAAAQKTEFTPVPLGVSVSIKIKSSIRTLTTANIAGVLTGSDPQKKNEYVIYTAHHDHLGIGKSLNGDSIYNGALDNASGVATMMTIAHAFTELPVPPERSIMFIAVAGEESGFLGSLFFVNHLPFPSSVIAANLNTDGVNIWGRTRDCSLIGYGKTSIDSTVKILASQQHRIVVPDQFPEKGAYYRSDQFSFAKIGVPAVSLSAGTDYIDKPAGWGKDVVEQWINEHYHQPSDEYSASWDWSGAVEDAQLAFLTGLSIANQKSMPYWMPLSEFAGRRK